MQPPEQPSLRAVLEFYDITVGPERREVPILCPIHDESRPSASMNEDEGLWNCQACGAGGDALTLIQLKEGYTDDFRSALEFAEKHFGTVQQPRQKRGHGRPARGGFTPAFRKRVLG